jgi:hypothetical protein
MEVTNHIRMGLFAILNHFKNIMHVMAIIYVPPSYMLEASKPN